MVQAFLTQLTVPKEGTGRTQQAIVVQSLYNRHSSLAAGGVNGRGDHHKRVVHVHNVRVFPAQQFHKIAPRVGSPDRSFCQAEPPQPTIAVSVPIGATVRYDLLPGVFEHSAFLLKNRIFTSGLLIGVMYERNLHDSFGSFPPCPQSVLQYFDGCLSCPTARKTRDKRANSFCEKL